jgi:LSD1 subclass zinc finger protein
MAHQQAYGNHTQFMNAVIVGWNEIDGPLFTGHKSRIEKIKQKLNSGDKNGAANEMIQHLEWLLKEICESIQAEGPVKFDGRYTVGDLLTASKKRVVKLAKGQNWEEKILKKYIDVEADTHTLNILSHYNMETGNISTNEIGQLFTVIENLHAAFLCSSCRRFLCYEQSSKQLRCNNGKCEKPDIYKTS